MSTEQTKAVWFNDYEFVVATSAAEANSVSNGGESEEEWGRVPDDEVLYFYTDDPGEYGDAFQIEESECNEFDCSHQAFAPASDWANHRKVGEWMVVDS